MKKYQQIIKEIDMESIEVTSKVFTLEDKGKKEVIFTKQKKYVMLNTKVNNNFIDIDGIDRVFLDSIIGEMEYRFRKGIGYKGYVHRLQFIEKIDENTGKFYKFKKEGKRLVVDKGQIYELEFKYIFPLILSPHITDDGLKWKNDYVIFTYNINDKQPVDEETLKSEAPMLFNYLISFKSDLENQSEYNKRVQNTKKFYGVIRVGKYTFGNYFVAIRDNTKLVANVVGKIKTGWDEEKIPIFDNHISYISQKLDGKTFISKEEAEYIASILNRPGVRLIVMRSVDSRSISSRLPIKIEDYDKVVNNDKK
jgi:hypothetical protein